MSIIIPTTYARFHMCDMCEKEDGRSTLYWKEKDFDLCQECIKNLFLENCEIEVDVKVKTRRAFIPERTRDFLFEKSNWQCSKCFSTQNLEIDHIFPFSLGGKTVIENLQVLCKKCNRKKSNGR